MVRTESPSWTRQFVRAMTLLAVSAGALGAQQSTITGRALTVGTNEPVPDARVMVVGTSLIASTNAEGRYTLRNVPGGNHEVRVVRIGYVEQKKPVRVATGETATLDFTLTSAPVRLPEMVTTATGETQRRMELGNAIATVGDVQQRVAETPITNTYDLLTARAPGVVVLPGSMTGTAGSIRIRGLNSISLSNAPIWVVDGVRFTAGSVGVSTGGTATTFLNGLNPEEIQDIEIVKGPSAATLYGTDAANGVIVVTTRKGRAGPARWTWYGEYGRITDDGSKYPTSYAIWGHNAAGALTRCTLLTIAAGSCTRDSVTSLNVLDTPGLSPLSNGNRYQYGVNVNGGTDAVRYFLSVEDEQETGPIKLPQVDIDRYNAAGQEIREEWMRPEKLGKQSFRANLSATLNPKLDVNITSGFTRSTQRLTQTDNNFFSIFYQSMGSPGFRQPGLGFTQKGTRGEELNGNNGYTYGDIFQRFVREDIQRFTGSAAINWRPFSWLSSQGSAGVDLADRWDYSLCRFQECPDQGTIRLGTVSSQHANNRNFSARLAATATWQARDWLNLQTTVGSDYTHISDDATSSSGTQLAPGGQTVGSAAVRNGGSGLPTADKTLGLYVQEQFGIRDRLFITGAVRSDQNSAFGTNFQNVVYPKASVSWVLSEEPFFPQMGWLNQLRLRSAYGAAGVQPGALDALVTFGSATVNVLGSDTPGLNPSRLGNPNLKPERSAEFEGGFDMRMLQDRVNLEVTYYSKQTKDALIDEEIAPSAAASVTTRLRNLGSVKNAGAEVVLSATLLQRRQLGWDVTIAGSQNANKVVSLGEDANGNPIPTIGTGTVRTGSGYPINALWYRRYTYDDANQNGIIESAEVTVNPDFEYIGYSAPTKIFSITNGFDLFDRRLRLNAFLDYKGGFYIINSTASFHCNNFASCPARSNPDVSLEDQAAYIANTKNPGTSLGYTEKGDFWRLREVSATLTLPQRYATMIRAQNASLSLGAKNLKVWSDYKGADPEENYSTGDRQTTFASSSPRQYYTMRLNLNF